MSAEQLTIEDVLDRIQGNILKCKAALAQPGLDPELKATISTRRKTLEQTRQWIATEQTVRAQTSWDAPWTSCATCSAEYAQDKWLQNHYDAITSTDGETAARKAVNEVMAAKHRTDHACAN